MTRDSLSHMFWECYNIQAFWRNVTVCLANKTLSINIELSYKKFSYHKDHIQTLMENTYLDVKTEKEHHACFNLKSLYLRETDWKR